MTKGFTNLLARYNKLWVALLGAIVTVFVQMYGSNAKVQVVVAVLTALGVYTTPNK